MSKRITIRSNDLGADFAVPPGQEEGAIERAYAPAPGKRVAMRVLDKNDGTTGYFVADLGSAKLELDAREPKPAGAWLPMEYVEAPPKESPPPGP